MPRVRLTDISLRSLKPTSQFTTYWDVALPGFGIRVSPKGRKTFSVMYGKERKRVTIGHYPTMPLAVARQLAKEKLYLKSQPSNPTVGNNSIETFLEASGRRLKPDTVSQYRLYLSALPDKPVQELTYQDIMEGINTWEGKPFSQNYAWATYRNFLNWCVEHEYINRSPLFRKLPPNKLPTRDRVLSDEELARVWNATEDNTYGRILRLLILTGQRRMEVRNLVISVVTRGDMLLTTRHIPSRIYAVTKRIKKTVYL